MTIWALFGPVRSFQTKFGRDGGTAIPVIAAPVQSFELHPDLEWPQNDEKVILSQGCSLGWPNGWMHTIPSDFGTAAREGPTGWCSNDLKMMGCLWNDGMKPKWLLDDGMTLGCLWNDGIKSKWLLDDEMTLGEWEGGSGSALGWWDDFKMSWKWRDSFGMMGWNQNDSWMTDWHWEGKSGTGIMGWLLNEAKMTGCLWNDGMKSKWLPDDGNDIGMPVEWWDEIKMTKKWLLDDGMTLWGWEWHWDDGMTSKWGKNDRMPTEWWDEIKMTPGWRKEWHRDYGMTSKWGENDGMPVECWDEIKMTKKMTPGWRNDIMRVGVALGWWDDF